MSIHETSEVLNAIHTALAAGKVAEAEVLTANALEEARIEEDLYEEWAEREAAAETAWWTHGPQFMADLSGKMYEEELPF